MAVTPQAVLTRNYTSTATSFEANMDGTLPASAQRLVLLLTTRAYTAGATRTITPQWNDTPVTMRQTSLLGTVTAQDDVHYWIGTLDSPSLTGKNLKIAVSGSIRGLYATAFLVDGSDDTVPIIVHDFQDRDVSGNTVVLNGTPARAGSLIVNASSIADNNTITSFSPSGWTSVLSGTSTGGGNLTSVIAYTQVASTAAIETTTQFGGTDVNRGGVLFEIQTAASAGTGVTESVSPGDSIGTPLVAVTAGLTEALAASDSASGLVPADTAPENHVGVWTGAAASWKTLTGEDSKDGNSLTVSGLSAVTIKGPGATFATASYARRTAPGIGSMTNFSIEFWVTPRAAGVIWYAGPRGAVNGNVARVEVTSNRAWQLVRANSTAQRKMTSANNAITYGTTYHVVAVFGATGDPNLYVNGEAVTLTATGTAVNLALAWGSDDEIAIGDPTGGLANPITPVDPGDWAISGSAQDAGDALGSTPTTINVANATQLTNALSTATAGTKIVVAAGTYSGNLSFSNAGTGNLTNGVPNKPIYIMAADPSIDTTTSNGVYFSGTVTLDKNWVGIIGRGIRINKLVVKGKGVRVSRCTFRDVSGVAVSVDGGGYKHLRLDRNWVTGQIAPWVEGNMNPGHDAGMVRIYNNYIKNHSQGTGNNESVISILTDQWGDSHLTIDGNLFDNVLNGIDNQQELHTIKVGKCYWRYNTIINSPRATITLRETTDCQIIGNWMQDGADLLVRGDGHLIKHNHSPSTTATIRLECGNAYVRNNDGTPFLGNSTADTMCRLDSGAGEWDKNAQGQEINKWGITTTVYDNSGSPPANKCRTAQAAPSNCRIEANTARIIYGKGWGTQINGNPALGVKNVTLTGNKYGWTAHSNASGFPNAIPGCTESGINANLTPQTTKIAVPIKTSADTVGPWSGTGSADAWWRLPIRSGRDWAAGGAFWAESDLWAGEAADTAFPDAGTGSSKGIKNSTYPGGQYVQTWAKVLGGAVDGADDFTDTQFDWGADVLYYFGDAVTNLPTGASYPEGSGWLWWTGQFIPSDRRTDNGDSSIWDEITAGTHDAKFIKFGERVVRKMGLVGHPVKRLIIDFHHEMNQSNIYQVFTGTRAKYKSAMERIINKVRQGAGQHIRFSHRPAYSGENANEGRIAAYLDWVPSNVDVVCLSVHPGQAVNSNANITKFFDGTLNTGWYGVQEFLDAATSLGKPIGFPEWSPRNEAGKACPVSKTFVQRFYDEILVPNKDRLVADCVYGRAMRDPEGYEETDTAGKQQWREMVPLRKTLWSGLKSS